MTNFTKFNLALLGLAVCSAAAGNATAWHWAAGANQNADRATAVAAVANASTAIAPIAPDGALDVLRSGAAAPAGARWAEANAIGGLTSHANVAAVFQADAFPQSFADWRLAKLPDAARQVASVGASAAAIRVASAV